MIVHCLMAGLGIAKSVLFAVNWSFSTGLAGVYLRMADRGCGLGCEGFLKKVGCELDLPQAASREYEFSSPPRRVVQTILLGWAVLSTFGGLFQPGGR